MPEIHDHSDDQEKQASNSSGIVKDPRVNSYNLNEGKGRLKTGRKAAALNAQQAEALKELLQWARQHTPD